MYKKHKIHFVGIGGVGMSGIAEVLLKLGYPVSGSDIKSSPTTRRLVKKGARISYGHAAKNIGDAEVMVVSSAIRKDNPEMVAALLKKIPIIQRAEMLAELMRFSRYGVAVSGTHGKTTTTSLVAAVLDEGGLDPTLVIGGKVNSFKSNAKLGRGNFMVAEADESDGSFLKLSPTIAVVTNIDREHMDFYKNFHSVCHAYLDFVNKIPFYGAAICCVDHPVVRKLIPQMEKRVVTYGFASDAHFSAKHVTPHHGKMIYELMIHGKPSGKVTLNIAGRHNVLNSLAALAVAYELEIPMKKAMASLKKFRGIERRCQILLQTKSVTVIDDYGHHPAEIQATLSTIREAYPGRRLVCLFQPHRFSRTKDLFDELTHSFTQAHRLFITDIYAAGEKALNEVSSKKLVEAIQGQQASYLPRGEKMLDELLQEIKPGDVLLSLGAGDVTALGKECARRLKGESKRSI